ncbi:MAG: hypothetical protein SXU28_01555 [Pseudomonadota bacterium]|nr:hypothetical protein [Pseudomonadota bacterium]
MKTLTAAAALAATMLTAIPTQAAFAQSDDAEEPRGSLYLRCDGDPNNMTGGESFARLLGAVTLLGLFAPTPESPDPDARLFGEEGVDACSQLIDGEKAEGNTVRRIPLILARALHQIEAKNPAAALEDVARARREATEADLVGNAYFDRSMGLSFSKIEAEAHLRMAEPEKARDAALTPIDSIQYSFVPLGIVNDFGDFNRDFPPAAERKFAAAARIMPSFLNTYASRLEQVGRFAEAASKRDALIAVVEGMNPDELPSSFHARAALSHALAGQWEQAIERATFARKNLAERRAEGTPESNAAQSVEILDLYDIVKTAHDGELAKARRNFGARSQWVEPSFGAIMEVNRRLREGATEEELFGTLATSPEEMWQKRYDEQLAVKLQKDTDNKTLFNMIQPYADVKKFEDRTKRTWRVEKKSKMMSKEADDTGRWTITSYGDLYSGIDSIVLHAALQARQRGKEGFTIQVSLPRRYQGYLLPSVGRARFLNSDDEMAKDALFLRADAVIAELSEVIPDPEQLKLRKKARRR